MHSISNPHNIFYTPPTREKPTGRLCLALKHAQEAVTSFTIKTFPLTTLNQCCTMPLPPQRNLLIFFLQLFTILPRVSPCYLSSCTQWYMGGVVVWLRESVLCWLVLTLHVQEVRASFLVLGTRNSGIVILSLSLPSSR
jgi:hypothetical protein